MSILTKLQTLRDEEENISAIKVSDVAALWDHIRRVMAAATVPLEIKWAKQIDVQLQAEILVPATVARNVVIYDYIGIL